MTKTLTPICQTGRCLPHVLTLKGDGDRVARPYSALLKSSARLPSFAGARFSLFMYHIITTKYAEQRQRRLGDGYRCMCLKRDREKRRQDFKRHTLLYMFLSCALSISRADLEKKVAKPRPPSSTSLPLKEANDDGGGRGSCSLSCGDDTVSEVSGYEIDCSGEPD